MMPFRIFAAMVAGLAVCAAQEPVRNSLTNHDIETLADAGFGEPFLIEMIATSRPDFDTSAEAIAELKKHGIKEDVIRAMRGTHATAVEQPKSDKPAFDAAAQPIRVFVEANPSSRAQTAEIVESFAKGCPALTVTSRKESAAFLVVLDRTPGKLVRAASSRMVVFDRSGDTVYGSQRSLEKAVRGFCSAAQHTAAAKTGESAPEGRSFAR